MSEMSQQKTCCCGSRRWSATGGEVSYECGLAYYYMSYYDYDYDYEFDYYMDTEYDYTVEETYMDYEDDYYYYEDITLLDTCTIMKLTQVTFLASSTHCSPLL